VIVKVVLPRESGAREYAFHRTEALIGSGRRTDVRIPVPEVAVHHARLRRQGDRVWLEPLRAGHALVVERAQVGRIKVSGPIALRPGDVVLLGTEEERATVELVSVDDSEAVPDAETLFDIGTVTGTAPPPLLEAVVRFSVEAAGIDSPGPLREAMSKLAQHFAVDAEVPAGLVLFGSADRPPRWWVPAELASRMRAHAALMTGTDWRRDVRERLERGEVLRAGAAGVEPVLVVVPLRGRGFAPGAWAFAARRPVALEALQAVARMVSDLLGGALERLAQSREVVSLGEENRYFRNRERRHYLYKELVTQSPAMRTVYARVHELLEAQGPVWILGEKGCGKEMLARALHHLSTRSGALMISQNCAKLGEVELDVELFGLTDHDPSRGMVMRPGLLELCDAGSLFLEEVEHLPPRLQTRLGRAIQEREVRPEGASIGRPVDVRLIVSSESDLAPQCERGGFRKDLYLQLAQNLIVLPPLRQRLEDIVPLADVFVANIAPRYHKAARRVAPSLHEVLRGYAWPGNVRELQSQIEIAIIAVAPDAEEITELPGLGR
jgi:transcriptional regulator with AAA-type ATPase domain